MFSPNRLITGKAAIILILVVIAASILAPAPVPLVHAAGAPPEIGAEKCLVADFKSGSILYAKDEDLPHVPASLTKIMTLYIVFDEISLGNVAMDDMVPISEAAWATEGSKMFVLVGTKVRLSDLIYGVTVMSGNDACVALAEYISGNLTSFIDRMNRKARDLGLTTAQFVDVHGLSDDNRISARDLFALTSSYAAVHPEALAFHEVREFTYTAPGEAEKAPQFNRNRLLWSYPGTFGLKTGFTTRAGFNMIALCNRSGFEVIVIVLGSARGKSIDQGERERAAEVTSLLDWAYGNYVHVSTDEPGYVVGKVRVWKGKGKWVSAVAPSGLSTTVEKGKEDKVAYRIELARGLQAPVPGDSKVGEVIFTCEGEDISKVDLVADRDVPRGNLFRVLWDSILWALARAFGRV